MRSVPSNNQNPTFFPAQVHTRFFSNPLDEHETPSHFKGLENELCVCACVCMRVFYQVILPRGSRSGRTVKVLGKLGHCANGFD